MLEIETYDLKRELCNKYPNLYLEEPVYESGYGMNSCEKNFLEYLIESGYVVFREPLIDDVDCIPDFFVYDPYSGRGQIVEITLMKEMGNGDRKTKKRKERQAERIRDSGIPYVILYREHLERIRNEDCKGLF